MSQEQDTPQTKIWNRARSSSLSVLGTPKMQGTDNANESLHTPTINSEIHTTPKQTIQTQLTKYIHTKSHLILPQFIELLNEMAPNVSIKDITDIFNHIDTYNNGQISTDLLITDKFLATIILKLLDDDEKHEEFVDINYYNTDINSNVNDKDTAQLQKWINDIGQPAIEKVIELEAIIHIYETQINNYQIQLDEQEIMMDSLTIMDTELNREKSTASILIKDNKQLLLKVQQSENLWDSYANQSDLQNRELERYKQLAEEMSIINDKYLKKNKQLTNKIMNLEKETEELRKSILSLQSDAMQFNQEYIIEREQFINQIEKLKSELQTQNESVETQNANDVGGLEELLQQNRTIVLNKNNLPLEQNPMNLLTNMRQLSTTTITTPRYFSRNSSRRDSLISMQSNNSDGSSSDTTLRTEKDLADNDITFNISSRNVLEDAMIQEIRKELRNEMNEDFEIKLQQKDIECQLELNKEKERTEKLKRKYQMLKDEYEMYNENVKNDILIFDDEKELNLQNIQCKESIDVMDELQGNTHNNEKLYYKLKKLWRKSSLLWSFPLMK